MALPLGSEVGISIGLRPDVNTLATNFTKFGRSTLSALGNRDTFTPDTEINDYLQPFKGQRTGRTIEPSWDMNWKYGNNKFFVPLMTRSVLLNDEIDGHDVVSFGSGTANIGTITSDQEYLLTQNTLIEIRGASNPANNGVFVIPANVTAGTNRSVALAGTVAESTTSAKIYFAGKRVQNATLRYLNNRLNITSTDTFVNDAFRRGCEIQLGHTTDNGNIVFAPTRAGNINMTGVGTLDVKATDNRGIELEHVNSELRYNNLGPQNIYLKFSNVSRPVPRTNPTEFVTQYLDIYGNLRNASRSDTDIHVFGNGCLLESMELDFPRTGDFVTMTPSFRGTHATHSTVQRPSFTQTDLDFNRAAGAGANVGRYYFGTEDGEFETLVFSAGITVARRITTIDASGYDGGFRVIAGRTELNNNLTVAQSDEMLFEAIDESRDFVLKTYAFTRDGWACYNQHSSSYVADSESYDDEDYATISGGVSSNVSTKYDTSFTITTGIGRAPIPRPLRDTL